jgi:uncharacterized RDD family membrane protein YckC
MPSNEPERIYVYGGFGLRLAALLVDTGLLYVLGSMARRLFLYLYVERVFSPRVQQWAWDQLLGVLVGFIYFVVSTATWGATPGKFILGLRVVDADGHRPSLLRVLLREVIGRPLSQYVLGLGYLAVAISPEKRGWHDHIGGTWVVGPAGADEIQAEFRVIEGVLATQSEVASDRVSGIHQSWRAALLREFARTHPEEVVVTGGILRRTGAVELI